MEWISVKDGLPIIVGYIDGTINRPYESYTAYYQVKGDNGEICNKAYLQHRRGQTWRNKHNEKLSFTVTHYRKFTPPKEDVS